MEYFFTFIIGVAGTFFVIFIQKMYKTRRKKKLTDDIELFSLEKKYLKEINESKTEMNRVAFSVLFLLISLIGLTQIVDIGRDYVLYNSVNKILPFGIWFFISGVSLKYSIRYKRLKNYDKTIEYFNNKIKNAEDKLKGLSNQSN